MEAGTAGLMMVAGTDEGLVWPRQAGQRAVTQQAGRDTAAPSPLEGKLTCLHMSQAPSILPISHSLPQLLVDMPVTPQGWGALPHCEMTVTSWTPDINRRACPQAPNRPSWARRDRRPARRGQDPSRSGRAGWWRWWPIDTPVFSFTSRGGSGAGVRREEAGQWAGA